MKPIIGLSPLYDEEKRGLWMRPGYLDLLYACGAIPLILPFDSDKVDVDQLAKVVVLTGCKDAFIALTGTLMMICFHIGWKAGKGESEEAGK